MDPTTQQQLGMECTNTHINVPFIEAAYWFAAKGRMDEAGRSWLPHAAKGRRGRRREEGGGGESVMIPLSTNAQTKWQSVCQGSGLTSIGVIVWLLLLFVSLERRATAAIDACNGRDALNIF